MNYVQAIQDRVAAGAEGLEPELLRLYTLLALVKGRDTTLRDVHDAWAVWTNTTQPRHRSLVPFDDLQPEVQALDEPFADAIRDAATFDIPAHRPPS